MRIIRFLGNVALWLGAVLGVVAGGVWVAGQFGVLRPLIVISGSMEPGIGTGDLLIARNLSTADVEVGDVVEQLDRDPRIGLRQVGRVSHGGDRIPCHRSGHDPAAIRPFS